MQDVTAPTTSPVNAVLTQRGSQRLRALDQMRGVVMLLMTVDHASDWLNKGRFVTDAAWLWTPGRALPTAQFLLRWVTHLCAPTFVFLAGAGIALSTTKRLARGESNASIDRALFVRGLFIALLDPLWMSPVMMEGEGVLLQVLYAIGASMMLMTWLRRVPAKFMLALSLTFCCVSEWAVHTWLGGQKPSIGAALVLTAGSFPMHIGPLTRFVVAYPVLPWLAIMMLGYACAGWLASDDRSGAVERGLRYAGLAALAVFGLLRAHNGYGNMRLLRDDGAPLQWLHVSKYPPSLTYVSLELGIMALFLSLLYALNRRPELHGPALTRALAGLTTLGRAALFYYVLHIHLQGLLTWLLHVHRTGEITATLVGATLTVLLLSVPVARYQRYKTAHPQGLTRYL